MSRALRQIAFRVGIWLTRYRPERPDNDAAVRARVQALRSE